MLRMLMFTVVILGMFADKASAWYDARTGRFLQRDPLGYIDGMNLYRYGSSAPIRYTDPFGLTPEQNTWDNSGYEQYLNPSLDFWLEWLRARQIDQGGNRIPVSASCRDRLRCVIRAISWVESRHGTGTGEERYPPRDPMQCGNPLDGAHDAISRPGTRGPVREGDLPGVRDYSELPQRVRNPNPNDGPAQAPRPFSDPGYVYPSDGHRSPQFDPRDSFFWGILWYLMRMNQSDQSPQPRGAWNLGDCSWSRLIDGAVRYNGGGHADYRENIERAIKESGCR